MFSLHNLSVWSFVEIIANFDRQHGLEFDCNQEPTLVQCARPLTDFNSICIWRWFLVMNQPEKTVSFFNYRKRKRIHYVNQMVSFTQQEHRDKNTFKFSPEIGAVIIRLTSHSLPVNPHWQTQATCVRPSTHFPPFTHDEGLHSTTNRRTSNLDLFTVSTSGNNSFVTWLYQQFIAQPCGTKSLQKKLIRCSHISDYYQLTYIL